MRKVIIVGCGYVGKRVAALWRMRDALVYATARHSKSLEELRSLGIEALHVDLDDPKSLAALDIEHCLLYYFAPPAASGQLDGRMRVFLDILGATRIPQKIVYISTTGVYGDRHGAWVTEDSPVDPQTPRARRRLDAENILRAWGRQHAAAVVILRVPGIYGPGRLPVDAIRSHRPVVQQSECGFSNRIHVDDLAQICVAAADYGPGDAIYNASDGSPGTMTDYFNAVADALGLQRPPVISRAEAAQILSAEMLSYLSESRRIDNRRMLDELGVTLRYPDLETGLRASIKEESTA